jgi:hypothetical protein
MFESTYEVSVQEIAAECWHCRMQQLWRGSDEGEALRKAQAHARLTGHTVEITRDVRQTTTVRWGRSDGYGRSDIDLEAAAENEGNS